MIHYIQTRKLLSVTAQVRLAIFRVSVTLTLSSRSSSGRRTSFECGFKNAVALLYFETFVMIVMGRMISCIIYSFYCTVECEEINIDQF